MNEDTIKQLKLQHIDTYKKAVLEIIKNNTDTLVNDIKSLIEKPPLDSMDQIKNKFLDLAKKNKIVLNIEELNSIVDNYRNDLTKCLVDIRKLRVDKLSDKLDKFKFKEDEDVIVFYKKDFTDIDKNIKKIIKEDILSSYEKNINKKFNKIFNSEVEDSIKDKINEEIFKYIKGAYQKQLMDSIDIKVLVKDTTFINVMKEQADRYLFTLKNSRLLNLD